MANRGAKEQLQQGKRARVGVRKSTFLLFLQRWSYLDVRCLRETFQIHHHSKFLSNSYL